MARPRKQNGAELVGATSGLAPPASAAANGRETGQAEDATDPAPLALGRISTRIHGGVPGVGGEDRGEVREESDDHIRGGEETAHKKSPLGVDNETSTTTVNKSRLRLRERQGATDGKAAMEDDEARAEAESSLRVISAAMRTVTAALSALAVCEDEDERRRRRAGGGSALPGGGLPVLPGNYGDDNSNSSAAGTGGAVLGGGGIVGEDVSSQTELPAAVAVGRHREEDRSGPGMFQQAQEAGEGDTRDSGSDDVVDGDDAALISRVSRNQPNPEDTVISTRRNGIDVAVGDSSAGDSSSAGDIRTVGEVAETKRSVGAATAYGRELARAAGTPTVDAIDGDVHLVALVAGKRSLTRLLHFVDLVSVLCVCVCVLWLTVDTRMYFLVGRYMPGIYIYEIGLLLRKKVENTRVHQKPVDDAVCVFRFVCLFVKCSRAYFVDYFAGVHHGGEKRRG